MPYQSTKTYGHEVGLSVCFRQWRAKHSHCRFLHGYALSIKFTFEAEELDDRNWVQDFGGLKEVKKFLQDTFDHKTIIAEDDPYLDAFGEARDEGLLDLVVLPAVGCEAFAEYIYGWVERWLLQQPEGDRVTLAAVEVKEHGANGAIYFPTPEPAVQVIQHHSGASSEEILQALMNATPGASPT